MKGKVKKTLIGVAALAFAFAGVGSLVTYEAKANTPALFEMVEGASVRTSADTSGIRFSLRVNSDQQTALSAYKAVEYGMLITQESEATIDEIYNAGEAVFAENGDWSFKKEDIATKKYVANITGNTLVDEKDDEGVATGNKLFNAALTNISQANFTKTYVGVGYIKTTSEGATDSADDDVVAYHFASKNDNERTITYVAEKAIAENDENAVGNAVVENYVSGGYANLGLTGADTEAEVGTETNPYVVEEADYDDLLAATANNVIYGGNTFMTLEKPEDIKTTFNIDRKYQFVWENADLETQVELFNSPSKTTAAYNYYTGADVENYNKSIVNPTAEYYEEFGGRYGVVSLKSSEHYVETTGSQVNGWRYRIRSASGWQTDDKDGWDNCGWDYMSVWMYVVGEQGESVNVSYIYDTTGTSIACNQWIELRVNHIAYNDHRMFNEAGQNFLALFVIQQETVENYDQANVFEYADNHTVYLDSVSFGKNALSEFSVAKVDSEQKAQITATKADWATAGEVTYTAKTPAGNTLNIVDGKFTTGVVGTYTVTASIVLNGETYVQSTTYEVANATDIMAGNEIEGFCNSDSVSAAYGLAEGTSNGDAMTLNTTAQWHEMFEGRYGVVSMQPVKTGASSSKGSGYGGCYFISSSVRTTSFYQAELKDTDSDGNVDTGNWDYVSIWIYIVGAENETVQVSAEANKNVNADVPCNQWYEYKVPKQIFFDNGFTKPYLTFAKHTKTQSSDKRSILWVGSDATANYTVYVDSMSYVTEA